MDSTLALHNTFAPRRSSAATECCTERGARTCQSASQSQSQSLSLSQSQSQSQSQSVSLTVSLTAPESTVCQPCGSLSARNIKALTSNIR
eukprot:1178353-Prorocentrum_minimum.AAC.2